MALNLETGRRPRTYGKRVASKPYMSVAFNNLSPPSRKHIRFNDEGFPQPAPENGTSSLPSWRESKCESDYEAMAGQVETGNESRDATKLKDLEIGFESLFVKDSFTNIRQPDGCAAVLKPRSENLPSKTSPERTNLRGDTTLKGVKPSFVNNLNNGKHVVEYAGKAFVEDGKITSTNSQSYPSRERRPRTRRGGGTDNRKNPSAYQTSHDQTTYVKSLLELASDLRDRVEPADFQAWANELDAVFQIEKIAEASYSEVYRLNMHDGVKASGPGKADESVLKLIPLKPQAGTGPKRLKKDHISNVDDVVTEARILSRMTVIPGFTNLRDVRVMRGRLPKQFIDAWSRYKQTGAESLFPDPSKTASHAKDQLWAVVEMQNAGVDLEKFPLQNAVQKWDIFWGVALALAKGEELGKFEVSLPDACISRIIANGGSASRSPPGQYLCQESR